ncbi:hypothetical protein FB567DRAFT_181120 [Paraphoma chrysanthemicola]|uniref:C2H2-type domain-containing protein n=1 Tax=Paraphoma chrysanthemicola TaxID=798071 RepID=A0A8K0RI80_9PLEO|nr:hypothetical protein FB567DRAFT_181120 [Paraphoma chrysanthemicola]
MSSVATKCDAISTLLRRIVDEVTSQGDIATTQTIQDNCSRLSIWTADIGALHESDHPLSVESRLIDHHEILSHTYTILDDLADVVFELEQITSGQREARVATAVEVKHSGELLDGTVRDESVELVEEVDSCIKRLFRVSRLIREAAPSDVFIKALSRKRYHFDDQYDISHVKHKYPKLSEAQAMWLSNRLGRAITQRRCYLSYVRDHGDKLASDSREEKISSADMTFSPSHPLIPNSTLPPPSTFLTKASTIGPVKNFATRVDEPSDSEDDTKSYTTVSQSIALPAKSILQSRIPNLDSLPAIQGFREVKCPFCYRLRKFRNEKTWRQHVFSDLRTYVCTFQHCSAPLFKDLNEWFEHEMCEHRPSYHCIVCSGQEFRTQSRFVSHIERQHPVLLENSAKEFVLQISKKALRDIPASECPFCSNWEEQLRAKVGIAERKEISMAQSDEIHVTPSVFKRHVAAHLEELALFAIPPHSNLPEDTGSAVSLVNEMDHMSLGSGESDLSSASMRSPSEQGEFWSSGLEPDQTMLPFYANHAQVPSTSSANSFSTNIPETSTSARRPITPNAVTSSVHSSDMDADGATSKDLQPHLAYVEHSYPAQYNNNIAASSSYSPSTSQLNTYSPAPNMLQSGEDYSIVCPYCCGVVFVGIHAVHNLIRHFKTKACTASSIAKLRYPCPNEGCIKEYSRADGLRFHMRKQHGAPTGRPDEDDDDDDDE